MVEELKNTIWCDNMNIYLFRYYSYLSAPIWLDNLRYCNSYASDLRQCTNAVGYNDCSHSEDIILTCSSSSGDDHHCYHSLRML